MIWSMEKSSSLGCPCHPNKYPRGTSVKAWDASRHPFFIGKNQVIFQDTIFLLLRILCVFLGASLILLSVFFVLFDAINCWTPTCFLWRRHSPFFIAKNTLVFTLIIQWVFSFSNTAFSFRFSLWFLFRSCYIFVSRCIYTTGLCWFLSLRVVSKSLNGVGKEKKFHAYSGTNGRLFRLWLRLLHVMFDVILIVCLVVFPVAWLVSNDWDCLMCLWKNHALFLLYGSILLWFSSLMLYLGWLGACLQHVWL
jgi:hypothetical protein